MAYLASLDDVNQSIYQGTIYPVSHRSLRRKWPGIAIQLQKCIAVLLCNVVALNNEINLQYQPYLACYIFLYNLSKE